MKKKIVFIGISIIVMGQPISIVSGVEDTSVTAESTKLNTSIEETVSNNITEENIFSSSDLEEETSRSNLSEQGELQETESSELEKSSVESSAVISEEIIDSTTETSEYNVATDYMLPSERSDLSNIQTFSAKINIPQVSATNLNVPEKSFIDVSSHNGDISVENYKIMKSYGVNGVVIKLTEATSYQNPYAKNQIKNALDAGMKVSVYHYSWFKTTEQARKEADYFASMANSLSLPKDTLMVNDIEEPKIAEGNNHTQNSLEFEKRLNELGFAKVTHYVGLHWITNGKINPATLGYEKIWVAAYPYVLDTVQKYTEYGAWQWSSQLTFPNVPGVFDISSDYVKNFTSKPTDESEKIKIPRDFKYASITKNAPLWKIDNQVAVSIGDTQNLLNQVLKINSELQDLKQDTYYLLENNRGVLLGYVKANHIEGTNNRQGSYHSYGKYMTVQSPNYDIWQNFNWDKRSHSSKYTGKVLQARGYYEHFNGSRYLSLYDQAGKWVGYINASGTKLSDNGGGGKYHAYNKYVTIQSPNYDIWQNFNWDKRTHSSKYKGKTVLAKGYYDHFNGARYLSLYETNGHWIGYINETGTSLTKGAGSYLGINRSNILNELNNNSSMYLNTPFRGSLAIPASVMSPIGNPNQYGPGFNCTGFIATALRNSGANINKVANATSGIGGVANAYNWRDALTANTDYYTFYSVDALLQSGKAKKGDLIYFEADFTKPNYDCHIGFFWGDTPSQNRFWHSTLAAGGNKITHIFSGTPFSKILLIPMD
jgi:GH25 family lysozyme M1 (1,4-beta-N-acetylmuramidase)